MAEALRVGPVGVAATGGQGASRGETTFILAVPDMHCGGCMRTVEGALAALPGVASARVNLSTKRVTISTREPQRNAEPFIAALERAGFAASPIITDRSDEEAAADRDYLRRLGVAGFAAANIMLLSVSVWSGHGGDMPSSLQGLFHWISAAIALPAIAYAGKPFFASARKALAAGRLNMDVPISLGVCLATAMSLYQTIRGNEHVYFDAAVTLLFFLLIGRTLDQRMRARAAGAAANLLALRTPTTSIVQADGRIERLATEAVRPGMRILVAAGERIPVDARLVKGTAEIDESLITGESRPRWAVPGDRLYSGTVNLSGPVEAEATHVAENTLLADIARLIESGEQARGRYMRLADRAARLYAPAVHILGAVTFIGWMLAGQGWEPALTAAIAVLIITCPCALALAVPAVQVVASGRMFQRGIVLKAADGLERLAEVDTVVLDKTGTLTLGEPRLAPGAQIPDDDLATAAGLAAQSRHPYAKAVVRAARERGLDVRAIEGANEVPGAGIEAGIGGVTVRLGSHRFCDVAEVRAADAGPTIWLRRGNGAPLALAMVDPLREDAPRVAATLAARGIPVEILSGDRKGAVEAAARQTGIATWMGELKPADKIARIEALTAGGSRVLMVGDGLNDAPALAAGHASLSPAGAADIAQTAADAVFQGESLGAVVEAIDVARAARRRALENFAIAIAYNIVFVPIAMAGLVTPLIAAIAMSASSIAVTANALRLNVRIREARP